MARARIDVRFRANRILRRHGRITEIDLQADVSKSQTPMELVANSGANLAIEYEMIFRAIARNHADGGVGKCVGKTSRPLSACFLKNSIRVSRA